jgi:hypothetical protein
MNKPVKTIDAKTEINIKTEEPVTSAEAPAAAKPAPAPAQDPTTPAAAVESTPSPATAQAIKESLEKQAKDSPKPKSASFDDKLQEIIDTGTGTLRVVATHLAKYATVMAPDRLTDEKEISDAQVSLFKCIVLATHSAEDFQPCYQLLADFFKAHHNDCCSMRYHSRGAEYIPLDKDEREALFAHCNILEALASVDTPKQVNRIVDINRSLPETVFDDDARSRILAYYGS